MIPSVHLSPQNPCNEKNPIKTSVRHKETLKSNLTNTVVLVAGRILICALLFYGVIRPLLRLALIAVDEPYEEETIPESPSKQNTKLVARLGKKILNEDAGFIQTASLGTASAVIF